MAQRYRDRLTGHLVTEQWRTNKTKRYGGCKRYIREQYGYAVYRDKVLVLCPHCNSCVKIEPGGAIMEVIKRA